MSSSTQLDPRARRWALFARYAALLVIGFLVSPYVWIALGGLVGLLTAGTILLATWMVLPAVEAAAANLRLKLIKSEAARNPVETLQNDLRDKTVALDQRKTAIERLNGQIRTFADKVGDIKERYGAQDSGYIKLNADLADLRRVAAHRAEKWKQARAQLDRYSESIDRAGMIWEAGLAAAAARESSGLSEDEFYSRLRAETAFDSIQNGYNEALASLDTSMLEADAEKMVVNVTPAPAALPAPDNLTIELPPTTASNKDIKITAARR